MRSTINLNKKTHRLQDYPWSGQISLPIRSGVRVHRTWSAGRRGYEGVESFVAGESVRDKPRRGALPLYRCAARAQRVSRPSQRIIGIAAGGPWCRRRPGGRGQAIYGKVPSSSLNLTCGFTFAVRQLIPRSINNFFNVRSRKEEVIVPPITAVHGFSGLQRRALRPEEMSFLHMNKGISIGVTITKVLYPLMTRVGNWAPEMS